MDRAWIHPSELAASRRPVQPGSGRGRVRRDIVLALSAGTIGALAAVTILGLSGALGRDRTNVADAEPVLATDAARVAASVSPAIAAIIATTAGVERRGSGVAVGRNEILTTTEVVTADGTDTTLSVTTADGRRGDAVVRGRDTVSGLVLLHVPGLDAKPVRWSDADAVRAGDWIVAVGRTAEQGPWVTSGVVTGVGGWMTDASGVSYAGVITTSTELAGDARGGALVDDHGNVVGILATTASAPARTAVLPGGMAGDVATQLSEHGRATHGSLGARAADSSAGVTLTEILPGSCASAAGLEVDDEITEIDGARTHTTASLVYELRRRPAGTRIMVTFKRGSRTRHVPVTLDDAATGATASQPGGMAPVALASGS